MKSSNILQDIYFKQLTVLAALKIVDSILDSEDASNIKEKLGLSSQEWTAYAQGADLLTISMWRFEGWPSTCIICGKSIDITKFGWKIVKSESGFSLKHFKCPTDV